MLTHKQYWAEVRSIANEVVSTYRDAEDADDRYEWLWESIDGHEFVIYTHKAAAVIVHTDHRNAWSDVFDTLPRNSTIEVMAFYAMMADVEQYIADYLTA